MAYIKITEDSLYRMQGLNFSNPMSTDDFYDISEIGLGKRKKRRRGRGRGLRKRLRKRLKKLGRGTIRALAGAGISPAMMLAKKRGMKGAVKRGRKVRQATLIVAGAVIAGPAVLSVLGKGAALAGKGALAIGKGALSVGKLAGTGLFDIGQKLVGAPRQPGTIEGQDQGGFIDDVIARTMAGQDLSEQGYDPGIMNEYLPQPGYSEVSERYSGAAEVITAPAQREPGYGGGDFFSPEQMIDAADQAVTEGKVSPTEPGKGIDTKTMLMIGGAGLLLLMMMKGRK